MIDALEIGYAIKDRRAELGLTQAQLAEAAGVSKRCLWSLELGQNPGVQLDKLTSVLEALGLNLVISPGSISDSTERTASEGATNESPLPAVTPRSNDGGIDALAILTGGAQ